jgi:hypothetical protein
MRRTVFLIMALSLGLVGCVDTYKGMAKIYGCDPAAIAQGYCTMPKKEAKR